MARGGSPAAPAEPSEDGITPERAVAQAMSALGQVETVTAQIAEAIDVVEPVYRQLVETHARLTGSAAPALPTPGRRPQQRRASSSSSSSDGGPSVKEQMLAMIVAEPGITVPQIQKRMGRDSATYLYNKRKELVKEELVTTADGGGLHPTEAARSGVDPARLAELEAAAAA